MLRGAIQLRAALHYHHDYLYCLVAVPSMPVVQPAWLVVQGAHACFVSMKADKSLDKCSAYLLL